MMRAFRSEWMRLQRPGMLLGGAGTIVGSTLLVTIVLFATADRDPSVGPTLCDVQEHPELAAQYAQLHPEAAASGVQKQTLPFCTFAKPDGLATPFSFAGQLIGIIALVLFAQNLGAEYSHGTLKVLLSREPRRLHLLAGKSLALALFVLGSIVVAFVAHGLVATLLATTRGIPTTAWFKPAGLEAALLLLLRVLGAALAWGIIGLLLAVLLRASAPAIGLGIGYTIVAEPIVSLAFNKGAKYLPGRALSSFVTWGTTTPGQPPGLGGAMAAALLAVYAVGMLAVAVTLFRRRDVSG